MNIVQNIEFRLFLIIPSIPFAFDVFKEFGISLITALSYLAALNCSLYAAIALFIVIATSKLAMLRILVKIGIVSRQPVGIKERYLQPVETAGIGYLRTVVERNYLNMTGGVLTALGFFADFAYF